MRQQVVFNTITSVKQMADMIKEASKSTGVVLFESLNQLLNNFIANTENLWPNQLKTTIESSQWHYKRYQKIESCYSEFIELFTQLPSFADNVTKEAIKQLKMTIKQNKTEIDFYFQPIAISNNYDSLSAELIKLFYCRTYYGKKDAEEFARINAIYSNELKVYNLYAIEQGISKLCEYKSSYSPNGEYKPAPTGFPSIPELKEAIEYHNNCSLQLYANANWILSL